MNFSFLAQLFFIKLFECSHKKGGLVHHLNLFCSKWTDHVLLSLVQMNMLFMMESYEENVKNISEKQHQCWHSGERGMLAERC